MGIGKDLIRTTMGKKPSVPGGRSGKTMPPGYSTTAPEGHMSNQYDSEEDDPDPSAGPSGAGRGRAPNDAYDTPAQPTRSKKAPKALNDVAEYDEEPPSRHMGRGGPITADFDEDEDEAMPLPPRNAGRASHGFGRDQYVASASRSNAAGRASNGFDEEEFNAPPSRPSNAGRASRNPTQDYYDDALPRSTKAIKPRRDDNEFSDEPVPRRGSQFSKGKGRAAKIPEEEEEEEEEEPQRKKSSKKKARVEVPTSDEEEEEEEKLKRGKDRRSQALIKSKKPVDDSDNSDEESGRDKRKKSKALTKSSKASKKKNTSKKGKHHAEYDSDEHILVDRFERIDFQLLREDHLGLMADVFETQLSSIERWCRAGRVRCDRKTGQLDVQKLKEVSSKDKMRRWKVECADLDFLREHEEQETQVEMPIRGRGFELGHVREGVGFGHVQEGGPSRTTTVTTTRLIHEARPAVSQSYSGMSGTFYRYSRGGYPGASYSSDY